MSRTLTLEGDANSVDTRVLLTTQGSVTAPSTVVPSGMTKIKKMYAAIGSDNAAAGGVVAFVRLGGNAVLNGEQAIMFGSTGGQTPQTGSDQEPSYMTPFVLEDADIDVRPSDTLSIAAEIAGADPGDTTIAVTVVFGK